MPRKKAAAKARDGKRTKKIIATSGGFDPLHVGHVRLLQAARRLGDKLVVILNNDNWLMQKKGYIFMPEEQRKEILEALDAVDHVVITSHPKKARDMSVTAELRKIRPHIFANGGDRTKTDANDKTSSLNPEQILCQELDIHMEFNVGAGGKVESSSELIRKAKEVKDKRWK